MSDLRLHDAAHEPVRLYVPVPPPPVPELAPVLLLPPQPGEERGWGRLKRVVRDYPIAPLELRAGGGAVLQALVLLAVSPDTRHVLAPIGAPWAWCLALGLLGGLQVLAMVYEWQRSRMVIAAVMVGMTGGAVCAYALGSAERPRDLLLAGVYLAMALTQLWIALRSCPIVALPIRPNPEGPACQTDSSNS